MEGEQKLRITMIGAGYVGLTTAAIFASLGNDVTLLDINKDKIEKLKQGEVPIFEEGLGELLEVARPNLTFISSWGSFNSKTELIIITVGTPMKENGDVDLTSVEKVAKSIGQKWSNGSQPIVIIKSTVPVGTTYRVKEWIEEELKKREINQEIYVASNPEFLREGLAVYDSLYPDRIVIGTDSSHVQDLLKRLYSPILNQTFPLSLKLPIQQPDHQPKPVWFVTEIKSAELIKYAANAFLAMKISFINEIARLAEKVGADITEVAEGIGLDQRIGTSYLKAGIGWGGGCFPKDTSAILNQGKEKGIEMSLVKATIDVNQKQKEWVISKLKEALGDLKNKEIGILGLSFKPNTDDIRGAISIEIIEKLLELGAAIKVYDPIAIDNFRKTYPKWKIKYIKKIEEIFEHSHAIILVTEWKQFKTLPYGELAKKMEDKIIIDGRNLLDIAPLIEAGFQYFGVGRNYS
ncbi:UDP-glucose/GDP-mannose dehydrogenase family protein [Tepidibacillus infernus]|uniref:UDP-glucose dehydrogenase family protein n=1 Tax=Tepidibacillus infernus TaxID=1806172 RepID=UPI003B6CBE0B